MTCISFWILLKTSFVEDWTLDKVLMFTAPEDINSTINTYIQRSSDFIKFVCNDLYPDAGGGNSSDPASLGN